MSRGKLMTIEGTEGAGKSTALQFIADYFKQQNISVRLTREPGGTEIAEDIRKILLHATVETVLPTTELLLMFASRAQHLQHCILPALAAGQYVISDRYIDASYAYQGGGRGIDESKIRMLDKFIVGEHYPQLTLLLDIPVELGFARAAKRGAPKDRIEQEKIDFFMRVRQVYLARAEEDPHRIKVVDASQSLAQVEAQIYQILKQFHPSQSP